MDFWDVAKLMWRRWYVTLPALLLTLSGALWTGLTVNPDYQVTGHVALVGPAVRPAESDTVTRINPWSGEALADAATIRLQGKALADTLEAEGYTGEWSALVAGRLPVIRLEVIGQRPEQAQATLQRLREAIELEVRDRQAEYNVAREQQVTTVDYDGGETVEAVTGKVKRALIVVVGAGLILTTGLVVAYDAIARRRQAAAQEPAGPPEGVSGAGGAEAARPRYQYAAAAGAVAVPVAGPPSNGAHAPAQVARTARPVQVRYADGGHPGAQYAEPPYPGAEYAEGPYPGPEPTEAPYPGPEYAEAPYRDQPYGGQPYPGQPYGEHEPAEQPHREHASADESTGWPASPAAPSSGASSHPPDDSTIVLPLSGIRSGRSGAGRHEPSTDVRTT